MNSTVYLFQRNGLYSQPVADGSERIIEPATVLYEGRKTMVLYRAGSVVYHILIRKTVEGCFGFAVELNGYYFTDPFRLGELLDTFLSKLVEQGHLLRGRVYYTQSLWLTLPMLTKGIPEVEESQSLLERLLDEAQLSTAPLPPIDLAEVRQGVPLRTLLPVEVEERLPSLVARSETYCPMVLQGMPDTKNRDPLPMRKAPSPVARYAGWVVALLVFIGAMIYGRAIRAESRENRRTAELCQTNIESLKRQNALLQKKIATLESQSRTARRQRE